MMAEILRIKTHRVKRQVERVREQEAVAQQLQDQFKQEELDLVEFKEHRIKREWTLFDELKNNPVAMADIEDFNEVVAELLAREKCLHESLADCKKNLADARDAVIAAKEELMALQRKEQKFERMTERVTAEETRAADLAGQQHEEELAMELYLNRGALAR